MKKYLLVVGIAILAIVLTLIFARCSSVNEEVTNEQTTVEKVSWSAFNEDTVWRRMADDPNGLQEILASIQEAHNEEDSDPIIESESSTAMETHSEQVEELLADGPEEIDFSNYNRSIPSQFKDDDILSELRSRLKDLNIEWWYPYAVAQMYQESRIDPFIENKNGLDKGLFQYRITFWDALCKEHGYTTASIFDWHVQMDIYVRDTARRLKSGCSINETVSRHNTSDYGTYNDEYVRQVMQWVY